MRCLCFLFLLLSYNVESQTVQTFTSSGTFTVPANVYLIKVEAWGAGGAGGVLTSGAKGGGGGGAYATKNIIVIPGASYSVTVGTGGIPTSSIAPSGGNSSFGSLVVAVGGAGANDANGGAGGAASGCTPVEGAISGLNGSNASGNNGGSGGNAGNGGTGGAGGVANNGSGSSGNTAGGGGGGKAGPGAAANSGSGGNGTVIVSYSSCPAPSISCGANVNLTAISPSCNAIASVSGPSIANICYRNHSLDFDGSNDYISLPSGLTSTFTNFTFEAWVFWDGPSSSSWQRIMDFGNNTNVNMFLTPRSDSGTPRFAITTTGGGGEQRLTSSASLSTGQWHHFAVVLDDAANTGSLYIDGLLMAQNTGITLTPASLGVLANNWIGRSQYADPYFNGKIDEVRIWNTTRTQSQIQANMNNEFSTLPTGLIAYYKFNNGIPCCSNSGLTTLTNESGSNHGTLLNFGLATGCASNWVEGATPIGNPLTLTNNFNNSCTVTSASFPTGITNITWTVTDGYGNSSTCIQSVTVTETQAPVITCPANLNQNVTAGNCSVVTTYTAPVGTDNCTGPVTTQTGGLSSGSSFPVGVTTNTFRVTDASGNTATCSFTVTVNDNQAPTITCPANVNQNAITGTCAATVNYIAPAGTDNCTGSVTTQTGGLSSGSSFPVGVTTNTFRVTDASGNTATCSFTVTVNDAQAPTITCPANINQYVITGTCAATVNYITPTGADNCTGSVTTQTGGLSSGSSFPVGVTTNTFRVTDAAGNTATCFFTVTVIDNEPPVVINCPSNITIGLSHDPIADCMTTGDWIEPTATDNCPGSVTVSKNYGPSDLLLLGDNIIVYEFSDIAGNANSSCSFTVSVIDDNSPQIAGCPGNTTINTGDDVAGNCNASYIWTEPVGLDDCDGPIIPIQNNFPGDLFAKGINSVSYEFYDNAGNLSTCTFTITVIDNEIPTISCPSNINQNVATGTCAASVTYTAPVGTDNCAGSTTTQTAGLASGASYPVGVTTNTFRVTDAVGNTATCSFTVTVVDNELPVITCPGNVNQNVATGTCAASVTYMAPVGTDNCAGSTTTQTAGLASGASYPVGVTTNTFRVTDAVGNTASCSFTVTIVDNELPVITCPGNANQNVATGTCAASVTYTAPVGTDNCAGSTTTQTAGLASGASYPVGVTTNTFRVTDAVGNTATCSFTVTIVDNELPVITCPGNANQNVAAGTCAASVTYTAPVGTDNCAGSTTTQTAGLASGASYPVGTTTNTFRVTDASGNIATCSFTVTIVDNELPAIGCPGNINQNVTAGTCAATVTYAVPVGTDNCAGSTTTQTSGLASGASYPVGTTTNTFRVTDATGNTATCLFTVTIVDNEPPAYNNCPSDFTIGLSNDVIGDCMTNGGWIEPTGSDNCPGAVLVTSNYGPADLLLLGDNIVEYYFEDVAGNINSNCIFTVSVIDDTNPGITGCPANTIINTSDDGTGNCTAIYNWIEPTATDDCDGLIAPIQNYFPGASFGKGVNTVTYEYYDNSGNLSVCTFTVTVIDNETPSIICPANVSMVTTMGICAAVVNYISPVGTDNCTGSATTQTTGLASGASYPVGITTNTYRVTDASGNSASCSFTVTIVDNELPVITCPGNINQNVATGSCAATVTYTPPVGADNCGGSTTTQTAGLASGASYPVGITTNTLRVTDASGNTATCSFTVTIVDNELPAISCPGNINQNVTAGTCAATVTYAVPVGTDNCGGSTTTQTAGLASGASYPVGVTTNTFRVTDASGNTAICSFTINVTDNVAPTAICQNIILQLDGLGVASTTAAAIDNGSSDNCGLMGLSLSQSIFGCEHVGSNNVVLTVSDSNGNTASCMAVVMVQDLSAPVASCRNVTAYLNNTGNVSVSAATLNNISTDACGIISYAINTGSFTCANVGTNGVVLTVTDINGNSSTCGATITVVDTIRPQAICQSAVVNLDPSGNGMLTTSMVNNGSNDACGIANLNLDVTSFTCNDLGPAMVVLTVTDVNGNTASCTANVIISDVTPPSPPNLPSVTLPECGGTPTPPTASDACGVTIIGTTNTIFPITAQGHTVVTWSFDDGNGNISSTTQSFLVDDITPPTTPVLPTVTSDCSMPVTLIAPTTIDNCIPTVTGTTSDPLYYAAIGTYTVNWTFDDGNGNSIIVPQSVVISNAGAPVLLNGVCYPTINAAISSGLNPGDVIHAYGNNLIESFEIPSGVTLEIHSGAVVTNAGMICNNGTILINGGNYFNVGIYSGQGVFLGNFVNGQGGTVSPGPCGN